MKLSNFLIGIVIVFSTVSAFGTERKLNAKLTNATIYYQGAELTYSQSIALVKGENEILLTGLSPNLDRNSIRITTSKFAVVNAFEYKIDYLNSKTENKSLKIWKDSLDICNEKIAVLNDNIANNENVLTLLKVNTSTNNEGNINFTALMSYADFYKTRSAQLMTELRGYKKQIKELSGVTMRLSQQIRSEEANNKQQGVLSVKINSSSSNTSDLKLVYYTSSASWHPYYDIVVSNTNSPLLLQSKAMVEQFTGTDWDNVHIKLTTSRPSSSNTAPMLNTWFVNFMPQVQPVPPASVVAMGMIRHSPQNADYAAFRGEEVLAKQEVEVSMDDYIEQVSNDVSQSFDISLPYTIAGNGGAQYIDLLDKSVKVDYVYYTIPKISEDAYIVAEVPNWESLDIMSGNANINFDGTFMGSTYVNANTTLEKMPITLGVDNRISVKREKLQDYSSKKTLGNNIVQTFTYKTTIKNNQQQKIKMTAKDQYPISQNKSITVNLLKETTPVTTDNDKTGELIWDFELAPGESKVLMNSFSVQYPKGQELNY